MAIIWNCTIANKPFLFNARASKKQIEFPNVPFEHTNSSNILL